MNSFEFATAGNILFGRGKAVEIPALAAGLGKRVLVVTGRNRQRWSAVMDGLSEAGLTVESFSVAQEPTVEDALRGTALGRETGCDLVIGIGGGSVLDAAKAIAALIPNPGEALDYLEVIGKGQPLQAQPLPWMAVPTTAGTGSEVTRNAVLAAEDQRVKVSMRSPAMLATIALVDPELTLSSPPAVTAASGMDALVQVIEPYVSLRANPVTDGLCVEGIRRAGWALRAAYRDGSDLDAREAMSLVSLMGGLSLANAGLGAVHGFAGPIGGMFNAPHGAVCAALLPAVMAANIAALQRDPSGQFRLDRYIWIARTLTGQPEASADEGVAWVRQLITELKITGLSAYGIGPADFPAIIAKAARASSMKANPIRLSEAELDKILAASL